MSGYNLPPGVTENMIPGNRPEDVRREEIEERVWEDAATVDGLREALRLKDQRWYSIDDIWSRLRDIGDIHQRVYEMLLEKRMREEE